MLFFITTGPERLAAASGCMSSTIKGENMCGAKILGNHSSVAHQNNRVSQKLNLHY